MKNGLISLDALIATIILIFLVIWLENFATSSVKDANAFGVQAQANSLAVGIGTQMNNFYALDPGSGDYLDLEGVILTAQNFSVEEEIVPDVKKSGNSLRVGILSSTASYPVPSDIVYDSGTKKVTET